MHKRFGGLFKAFGVVLGGRILSSLAQAALLILLARSSGPSDFGVAAAVYGVLIASMAIADMGLATFALRQSARPGSRIKVRNALYLHDLLQAVAASLLLIGCVCAGVLYDARYLAVAPLCLWSPLEKSADAWSTISISRGRPGQQAANLGLRRFSALGLFATLFASGTPPLLAYSISLLGSAILGAWHSRWCSPEMRYMKGQLRISLLKPARSYYVNSVAAQFRAADGAWAFLLFGSPIGALYSSISRLSSPMRLFVTSFASVLLPFAAREERLSRRLIISVGAMAVIQAGLLGSFIFAAPWIIPAALGPEYGAVVRAGQILAAGLVAASIATLCNAILQGLGCARFVSRVSVVTTVVLFAGVGLGGTVGGLDGCAVGAACAYLIQATLSVVGLLRTRQVSEPSKA